MKKLLGTLILTITFTLSSCTIFSLDYKDFSDHNVSTYFNSEQASNNRYILYYYDSSDDTSKDLKKDILNFFEEFNLLEYYLLDTSNIQSETSIFGEYDGEPIIYIVSSNQVYKSYSGKEEIDDFIHEYSNITFDYDLFESQHITTYQEALEVVNDGYLLYYYLPTCPYCIYTQPYFLPWAFTKNVEDIYFMDGSKMENADQIPTELIILNSGTPILVLMSNGEFDNEFYSGSEPVIEYINKIGTGEIGSIVDPLEYEDFEEFTFSNTSLSLIISDNLHFEYYYSQYCGHCSLIKPVILNFFDNLEVTEFYIMDISKSNGSVNMEGYRGVPVLYLVDNNEVVAKYEGSLEIPAFIEAYENGEIDLIASD